MKKIAIALSGGVDSALSALLLKNAGYEVIGITLKVQNDKDGASVCAGDAAIEKAAQSAAYLGIEHHVCDVCDAFSDLILKYAWDEYANARTPSPCVRCNERIKFGKLLDFALALGCEKMATGHYARIADYKGVKRIQRGADPQKDQSYFLSGLKNEITDKILFPLGELEKTKVRELATAYGLPAAKAKDSQNVCITRPGQTFAETLCDIFEGNIVKGHFIHQNKIIKPHDGIHKYTIGQRHGLGNLVPTCISFVKTIGPKDVEITTDPKDLETCTVTASHVIWHTHDIPEQVMAQIRYRTPASSAHVLQLDNNRIQMTFDAPVRAATPGQILAIYDGNIVIGRGIIE